MSKEVILKPNKSDRKFFHLETKIDSSKSRRIKGFASTRFLDRQNDVVLPGALERSMNLYMQNPVVLRDHDMSRPVGRMLEYQITLDGLYVTDEIGKGTADCDETWALIEQGILKGLSIGFIPLQVNYEGEFPIIEDLELIEHSVVAIPANRESLFSIAKAFKDGSDLIEKLLPKVGFDKTVAEFEASLKLIESNYKHLAESEKLRIDGYFKRLQNVCEGTDLNSTSLSEEIQLLEDCLSLIRG